MTTRPRVGLCILPERPWREAVAMWREVEDLGFDHGWTYDHMTWGGLPDSPWYAAMPTLTAAALATSRLHLGTFVSSPNTHHPAQFIREILAVHDISGGRFLLGVGAGGDVDAAATGQSLTAGERTARFREFTLLLDALLRGDPVTLPGEWFSAVEVGTRPGPLNRPEGCAVPLLVAANGPRGIRLAAERGTGWITYGGRADTDAQWWSLVRRAVQCMIAALDRAGVRDPFPRVLGLDSAPTYSLTSADAFEDALGRAEELGFTDVVTCRPRPTQPYAASPAVLEDVASRVLSRTARPFPM
ncbi:MAG: LLM class flavin-dependent oxidoreductase [Dermatophilaceae bacterium]